MKTRYKVKMTIFGKDNVTTKEFDFSEEQALAVQEVMDSANQEFEAGNADKDTQFSFEYEPVKLTLH
jgi:hypothetical protein